MKSKKKGVTLIEILVAMVVIGVVIIPIAALFSMNLVLLDKAWDLTRVMAQTENKMEEISGLPFAAIMQHNGETFQFTGITGSGVIDIGNSPSPNAPTLLRIRISVRWKDSRSGQDVGTGQNFPIVLETFLAKRY